MKKSVVILAFYLGISVVMIGCNASKVDDGVVRDTIFSAEQSRSGTWGIFLTHDESVVYCTPDQELGRDALNLLLEHRGEVIIHFKTLDNWRDTEGELWGDSECQDYYNFTEVILTSIRPIEGR